MFRICFPVNIVSGNLRFSGTLVVPRPHSEKGDGGILCVDKTLTPGTILSLTSNSLKRVRTWEITVESLIKANGIHSYRYNVDIKKYYEFVKR